MLIYKGGESRDTVGSKGRSDDSLKQMLGAIMGQPAKQSQRGLSFGRAIILRGHQLQWAAPSPPAKDQAPEPLVDMEQKVS